MLKFCVLCIGVINIIFAISAVRTAIDDGISVGGTNNSNKRLTMHRTHFGGWNGRMKMGTKMNNKKKQKQYMNIMFEV